MIILFHILNWYAFGSSPANKCKRVVWDNKMWFNGGALRTKDKLTFDPPAYIQRYAAVAAVIKEFKNTGPIKKIVDFGCAEFGFFQTLKKLEGVSDVILVDIDRELLYGHLCKTQVLIHEHLFCTRSEPLTARVFAGGAHEYDPVLEDVDVVVAIELVEHLTADHLEKFPHNIFGKIKPRVAIITTPNSDFNELFPNFSGFRHPDHKFEWTRSEFLEWVEGIVSDYPEYTARLYGIAPGPENYEHLGCCSQMAVFHRETSLPSPKFMDKSPRYELIKEVEFPFWVDTRSFEEKVIHAVQYRLNGIAPVEDPFSEERRVHLKRFLPLEKLCNDVQELRAILHASEWTIEDDENGEAVLIVPALSYPSSPSYNDAPGTPLNDSETEDNPMNIWDDWGDPLPYNIGNEQFENTDKCCDLNAMNSDSGGEVKISNKVSKMGDQ